MNIGCGGVVTGMGLRLLFRLGPRNPTLTRFDDWGMAWYPLLFASPFWATGAGGPDVGVFEFVFVFGEIEYEFSTLWSSNDGGGGWWNAMDIDECIASCRQCGVWSWNCACAGVPFPCKDWGWLSACPCPWSTPWPCPVLALHSTCSVQNVMARLNYLLLVEYLYWYRCISLL
jgi:hypothetical protein